MLNDEDEVEELVTVVTHLLRFAIDDPGFPNPKEAVTASGLKVVDLEVTEENMSEVLRIFVRARNGKEDEVRDCRALLFRKTVHAESTFNLVEYKSWI